MAEKNKYWVGVLYPENMISTWQDDIGDLLQVPYCYCIHDKDSLSDSVEDRKIHVHIMFAYNNTTTYKNAMNTFSRLSASGKNALNTCQAVLNVKHMYNYLIHDTEDCRKKHKHIYLPSERICGNNFDIGSFEQLSNVEKNDILYQLCCNIINDKHTNFTDFFIGEFGNNFDAQTFEVVKANSGILERLCKGNYLKFSSRS